MDDRLFAIDRQDHVAAPQPGGFCRLPRLYRGDLRPQGRHHAGHAFFVLADGGRNDFALYGLAVADDRQLDRTIRLGHRLESELFPRFDRDAADLDDLVAWQDPRLLRRRVGLHGADDDCLLRERGDVGALIEHESHHDQRQRQVHDRPHDQDLEALPLAFREEFVRRAGARVFGVLAGHLDVAAERDRADAVLGVPAAEFQQLWAEPEREGQHPDADPPRRQEVPELVDEYQNAQNQDEPPEIQDCVDDVHSVNPCKLQDL